MNEKVPLLAGGLHVSKRGICTLFNFVINFIGVL